LIEKDESPIEAVRPSNVERSFLLRIVEETTDYGRSSERTDMYFQGHSDQTYFGAYSTKVIRRGAGKFIFGFDRRGGVLRFAFPIGVAEPYRLAKSWTGDPSRKRAVIEIVRDPDEEMVLYLIELGRRSIDYHYSKESSSDKIRSKSPS
jgi:hypothetical protein